MRAPGSVLIVAAVAWSATALASPNSSAMATAASQTAPQATSPPREQTQAAPNGTPSPPRAQGQPAADGTTLLLAQAEPAADGTTLLLAQAEPAPDGTPPRAQAEPAADGTTLLLAQAEPAPNGTPSPPRAQAQPAADGTTLLLAQAEPAPDDYVAPGHSRPDPTTAPPKPNLHPWVLDLDADLVAKLSTVSPKLPPVGWGAGITITRALAFFGPMRFGLGAQFGYQRIERLKLVHSFDTDGQPQTLNFGEQFLAHTTFAALLALDGIFGRVRPWFNAGAGLSVAQYYDPTTAAGMSSINVSDVIGLITLATGVAVEITRGIEVGLAGHFDFLVSSRNEPAAGTTTPTFSTFSPGLFSARLQVGFRF